jgi:tetratricopeptide (TPR) repeat protein
MMPVLGVFAAHAVVMLGSALRARDGRRFGVVIAASAVLAALVQAVPARVDRTPAKGLWQLGVIRFQDGDYAESERLLLESIEANPKFPLSHQDLGFARMRLGRASEALADFEDALRLAPQTIGALQGRVDALLALDRRAEAASAAREYVRAAPLLSAAHYTLGRSLLLLGDASARDEARAALRRAAELATNPDERFNAHLVAGELERGAGRAREAIAEYDAALAARGEPDADGWFWTCQTARLQAIASDAGRDRARQEARVLAARFAADPRAAANLRPFLAE